MANAKAKQKTQAAACAGESRFALPLLLTLSAAFGAFLLLNLLTPLYMDDYSYMRDFATKEPVSSLSDLLRSMAVHYEKVNGRYVPHFLAQLFLMWGKGIFNFLNAAAGVLLLSGMYAAASPRGGRSRAFRPAVFLAAGLGLWICVPAFGQSCLWLTGACNYLWGGMLAFAALALSRRPPSAAVTAAVFILGFLAGNTAENGAAALLVAAVGYAVSDRLCTPALSPGAPSGAPRFRSAFLIAGVLTGIVLTLAAPGEWVRLTGQETAFSLSVIAGRTGALALRYLRRMWLPLLSAAVLLLFCRLTRRPLSRAAVGESAALMLGSLAGQFSLILSPAAPDRALCFPVFFGVAALLRLYTGAFPEALRGHAPRLTALVTAAAFAVSFGMTAGHLYEVYRAYTARDLSAKQQVAAGARLLTLPILSDGSRFTLYESWGDLDTDPAGWQNVALARYYGADAVTGQK